MRSCDVDYGWNNAHDHHRQYTIKYHSLRSRFYILKGYYPCYQ